VAFPAGFHSPLLAKIIAQRRTTPILQPKSFSYPVSSGQVNVAYGGA